MVFLDDPPVRVKALPVSESDAWSPVEADVSFDMWSFGCVLFELVTNASLFLSDNASNVGQSELRELGEWSEELRERLLGKVQDRFAFNLLSRLLVKKPEVFVR